MRSRSQSTRHSGQLTGLSETSADVGPGDSGGPLRDAEGEVVGIDVAASNGSTRATVQVGAKPYLGVQVTDASAAYPNASDGGYLTAPALSGADVAAVADGSPTAQVGSLPATPSPLSARPPSTQRRT